MEIQSYQNINLTTGGGTYNVPLTAFTQQYRIFGTGTLSSSWTIQPDPESTPTEGMTVTFYYYAALKVNGNGVNVFGYNMLPPEAGLSWSVKCIYTQGQWVPFFLPNYADPHFERFFSVQTDIISTSSILSMNTSEILIVPPFDAADIDVIDANVDYIGESTPFDGSTDLWLITDTATAPQFVCVGALGSTVSRTVKFTPYNVTDVSETQLIQNKGLYLTAPGYNPRDGNGAIRIEVVYRYKFPPL